MMGNVKIFALMCSLVLTTVWGSAASDPELEPLPVPTDFVRDVMQPIGVPVVSAFHAIRESIFLNVRTSNAHPLESIGNFFLTPSQYLFGEKKSSSRKRRA